MPPPLIHIGYHKTGTNWLQRCLFNRADLGFRGLGKKAGGPVRALAATHALDFDAAAMHARFQPLLQAADAEGQTAVVSFERLAGHPFSGGFDSKELADRLASVFPDARVLAVIREQRSIIASTYKQYVRAGGACSVGAFLEMPMPVAPRVPWFDYRHFEYDRLLRHYTRLFGRERVLWLPYDHFATDPSSFVASISQFAGMSASAEQLDSLPYQETPNRSPSAATIGAVRRINAVGVRTDVNPRPLLASTALSAGARALRSNGDRFVPRRYGARSERRLRGRIAAAVGDRYAASNRRTADLIGVDLGAYGWTI